MLHPKYLALGLATRLIETNCVSLYRSARERLLTSSSDDGPGPYALSDDYVEPSSPTRFHDIESGDASGPINSNVPYSSLLGRGHNVHEKMRLSDVAEDPAEYRDSSGSDTILEESSCPCDTRCCERLTGCCGGCCLCPKLLSCGTNRDSVYRYRGLHGCLFWWCRSESRGRAQSLIPPDAVANHGATWTREETYKRVVFVTMSMWASCASMVVLQQKLKSALGIDETGHVARQFTFAVSMWNFASLFFRLAHNVVLAPLSAAKRVLFAQISMLLSLSLAIFLYKFQHFDIDLSREIQLMLVGIAFFLEGTAAACMECNIFTAIAPLGEKTKVWALAGIPIGFSGVGVIGFLLMGLGLAPVYIYIASVVAVLFGMYTFHGTMPTQGYQQSNVVSALKAYRDWVPTTAMFWFAAICMNITLTAVTAAFLYIYNGHKVPLYGPVSNTVLIPHDYYFSLIALVQCVGDVAARKIAFSIRNFDRAWTRWMVVFICILMWTGGSVGELSKIGYLGLVGGFLIFAATG
jgi:hypothetical protein